MKKLLYFLCPAFLVCSLSCNRNKQCSDYIVDAISLETNEYFGRLVPGNWWVYQNTGGTKKDSVYIVDYSATRVLKQNPCVQDQEIRFTIKNTFLAGGDLYAFFQSGYLLLNDMNFSTSQNQPQSADFPQFHYDGRRDKFTCTPTQDNPDNIKLDSVKLNNTTYYQILQGKAGGRVYYFAQSYGLVGWTANGETFNLVRYRIM